MCLQDPRILLQHSFCQYNKVCWVFPPHLLFDTSSPLRFFTCSGVWLTAFQFYLFLQRCLLRCLICWAFHGTPFADLPAAVCPLPSPRKLLGAKHHGNQGELDPWPHCCALGMELFCLLDHLKMLGLWYFVCLVGCCFFVIPLQFRNIKVCYLCHDCLPITFHVVSLVWSSEV